MRLGMYDRGDYLGTSPSPPERYFMRKYFSESQHNAIYEWQDKIDGCSPQERKDCWRFVKCYYGIG